MAELEEIDVNLSKTIINLFDDDFTIPFLCRYRKDLIENLSPVKLREIKETTENVKSIEAKASRLLKSLESKKLLTEEMSRNLKSAKSIEELEHLSLLYNPASKDSLYERAQKIGLEPSAKNILYGHQNVNLSALVNPQINGLKTIDEVENGLKDIISHLITRNELVMNEVRDLKMKFGVTILSSQVKQTKSDTKKLKETKKHQKDLHKFENYFNFSSPADRIRPHQILALHRGESLKVYIVIQYIES